MSTTDLTIPVADVRLDVIEIEVKKKIQIMIIIVVVVGKITQSYLFMIPNVLPFIIFGGQVCYYLLNHACITGFVIGFHFT